MQPTNETPTEPIQAQSHNNQTLNQAPEVRKSSKAPWAVAAAASVVAIAGIAFGIYGMMKPAEAPTKDDLKVQIKNTDGTTTTLETDKIETKDNETTITITDSKKNISEDAEVQTVIQDVQDLLKKNYGLRFIKTFNEGVEAYSTIKIPGSDVYTSPDKSYGIIAENSESVNTYGTETGPYTLAASYLKENGFIAEEDDENRYIFYNSSTNVYCHMYKATQLRLGCGKATWLLEDKKQLVLSLAKAANTSFISADPKAIENSLVSPYQRITAGVYDGFSGAAALFYRVSPEAEWKFFSYAQAPISCSEFTGDIANAFAGTQCWDSATNQESTVNPNN